MAEKKPRRVLLSGLGSIFCHWAVCLFPAVQLEVCVQQGQGKVKSSSSEGNTARTLAA